MESNEWRCGTADTSENFWICCQEDWKSNGQRLSHLCRIRTRATGYRYSQFYHQSHDGPSAAQIVAPFQPHNNHFRHCPLSLFIKRTTPLCNSQKLSKRSGTKAKLSRADIPINSDVFMPSSYAAVTFDSTLYWCLTAATFLSCCTHLWCTNDAGWIGFSLEMWWSSEWEFLYFLLSFLPTHTYLLYYITRG